MRTKQPGPVRSEFYTFSPVRSGPFGPVRKVSTTNKFIDTFPTSLLTPCTIFSPFYEQFEDES